MELKPLKWLTSTKENLGHLPEKVEDAIGYALHLAQIGEKSDLAKPLHGFKSANVLEIVEYDAEGTYRAVYTVRFKEIVVVLHVFKKKSKQGIATPKQEIDLVKARLKHAEQLYPEWLEEINRGK